MAHIGVLALQGDYEKHARALERAGAQVSEVRTASELAAVDGLVIPGGESTTMLKLLDRESLFEPLRKFGSSKPIFGTCAGAILLAAKVENPEQPSLGLVDIDVRRNGYGRQLDSRVAQVDGEGFGKLEAVFIRAPIIRKTGPGVHILASYKGDPVLVEQGRHLVATFHPELSGDDRVHAYFLRKVMG
ncbi:MAG: pyridoxal 5'-phosphate synthase glutaminase subunit PdxT [Bryobacteraceae bacterium]